MKPLFPIVVAILIFAANALPESGIPIDTSISGSDVISTHLPPVSTKAREYLPPIDGLTGSHSFPQPSYTDGQLILDNTLPPTQASINTNNLAGCAAALKCTPIEFCTAEGVISNTIVALTRKQEAYRVPLSDCKDLETGHIGKCCRDPLYTDPWPTNQLGKWIPGVFGYKKDKNNQPAVTPPVLTNFRTTPKPTLPLGPNQVTQGFPSSTASPSFVQKTQFGQGSYSQGGRGTYTKGGQGSYSQGGQGQVAIQGQGQYGSAGQGQLTQGSTITQDAVIGGSRIEGFRVTQGIQGQRGQDFTVTGRQVQYGSQGQGQIVSQVQSTLVSKGQGSGVKQGSVFGVPQGFEFGVSQRQGQTPFQDQGQKLIQGQGEEVTRGFVSGNRQGKGYSVLQNGKFDEENEFGESMQRVSLSRYTESEDCGVRNPLKPYGNHQDLEVDFAEIPWQAMILLQTNRSLLCGGVITRPDVVITSASCVEGLGAKDVLIKGGEWKLGIDEEPLPFQIVQVKHILRHPAYTAGSFIDDVAILVLTENLRLAKNIWPICLPSANDTLHEFYNGAGQCIVTGWGKSVLQAHLLGSIMHSMKVSLLNPGECQAKITQDYPHLQEHYSQESSVCGQPTNPANNICKVDIGSALACTTGDNHFVLRGIYSWDTGCQVGNQLASFYKFDLEWYEWAIGLTESVHFAQYVVVNITKKKIIKKVKSPLDAGIKTSGVDRAITSGTTGITGSGSLVMKGFGLQGQSQTGEYSQFGSNFGIGSANFSETGEFAAAVEGPTHNSISAKFTEKKFYQTEPEVVTYTAKPETITFTTKPEIFTYTTKPKIVTYTTKPEIVNFTTKPEIVTYTTKPKIVTYTTKPEIVTFTTKPEIFTYTTKPKIVTYTTKPEIVNFTTKPEIVTYTTKPKIVTYTTKPEIVTFTTKPEIVTYTTKPKIVTYTTKPEIVTFTTKPKIVTYTTKPEIISYTTKPKIVTTP